jgi:competence protein ComGC
MIVVLVIFILAIIVLLLTNYIWKRENHRKQTDREGHEEKFNRLLEHFKKQNNELNPEVSDTTGAE